MNSDKENKKMMELPNKGDLLDVPKYMLGLPGTGRTVAICQGRYHKFGRVEGIVVFHAETGDIKISLGLENIKYTIPRK
jgi:hypothetical protein